MKKLILAALVLTAMISCKKDKTCWECKYGIVNGYQKPDSTICNNGEEPPQERMPDGTEINSTCQKL